MPLYGYACPDCGKTFDVLQKFSDAPVTTCPSCGAGNVHKKLSAPAFHLKGGGWYKDHYGLKSGGGESAGGVPTAGSSDTAAVGSSSTATAPASPTPAAPSAPAPVASTGTS